MLAVAILVICAILIAYVLFGYPLLLAYLARHRTSPVQAAFQQKSVSVVLAVYNGETYIADKLRSILALDYPPQLLEILVISDGSTDGTEDIVESFAPQGVRLIRVPHAGKCAALNADLTACSCSSIASLIRQSELSAAT
jgi:cellulose synthase/poly-beta-1,6-N-acetylglucosamine synthase-like glycosyltransferase